MKYIPTGGTFRDRHDHAQSWYRTGSPFDKLISELGYVRVDQNKDPLRPDDGFWKGDINGLLLQRLMWWRKKHPAWKTCGETWRKFVVIRRAELLDGVTAFFHSHAGQCGAYGIAGLSVGFCAEVPIHVVTCDMPVRADMADVYFEASKRVRSWTHLYSERGWKARMRWMGDGQLFRNPRKLPVATRNIEIKGWHSGYLSNQKYIGQWNTILGGAA